ncbi:MAG: hypothetical protein V3W44_09595 [Dehalococcoidales bacterium]
MYSVLEYFKDYKRGSLGSAWDLPSVLYDALRIVEIEESRLECYLSEESERQHGHN